MKLPDVLRAPRVLLVLLALGFLVAAAPAAAQDGTGTPTTAAEDKCPKFSKNDAVEHNGGEPLPIGVWGRLCQMVDGEVVFPAGVTITVTEGGEEVASTQTDDIGFFVVAFEQPGDYSVTLDVETLPEGVALTNEGTEALTADGQAAQRLVFRLGEDNRTAPGGGRYITAAGKGLRFGLILAVASIGLSLVFGVTGLVNFAHAELVTAGAIAVFMAEQAGIPFWGALPVGVALGVAIGWGNDRGVWRPLRQRKMALLSMMVVSIGLGTAVRNIFQVRFGSGSRSYKAAAGQVENSWGSIRLTDNDLKVMAVCLVILALTTVMLRRSRIGTAIRAVADNPDLAESSGIDVDRVVTIVWMLCGGFAALGGALYGMSVSVEYDMGFALLLSMFAAVVLGGLGNAYGAILGALVIGIVQEVGSVLFDPAYKFVVALVVLILVLLVRPQGILGREERFG